MRRLALSVVAACVLLSACAKAPLTYNWGEYSSSLYKLKKDPSDENLQAHKEVLVQIIQGSNQQSLRVPPGLYAEYGYILVKEGKIEQGIRYLDLETQTYPESKVFVERVKAQAVQPPNEKEQKQ